jgi:hypothetical protein
VRTTESDVLPRFVLLYHIVVYIMVHSCTDRVLLYSDGSNISDILGLQKRATAKVGNGQGGGKEKRIHFPPVCYVLPADLSKYSLETVQPSTVPAKSIKQTPKVIEHIVSLFSDSQTWLF